MQKVESRVEGGVNMCFVNSRKCALNFTLSLLIPIFNICTFSKFNSHKLISNSNTSFIDKVTNLDEQIPKNVNTMTDKNSSKFTFFNNHKSNYERNFRSNVNSLIVNNKITNIDKNIMSIGKLMLNKISSLQKIYFLNICPKILEKNIFNQVHNANIYLDLLNAKKKYVTVIMRKLGIFVKQNASPG